MKKMDSWHLAKKLIDAETLKLARAGCSSPLVFTNGCFDLFHYGHLRLLEQAGELGDLVVAINSDASVKRLKGPERPIIPEHQRMAMVASVGLVKHVLLMDDDNPIRLIGMLQPDVHVKGGDWKEEDLPETPIIRSYGGRVVIVRTEPGWSTTSVIAYIRELAEDEGRQ